MSTSDKLALLDTINIPYADGIRGNITLPGSVNGESITWKSSDSSIISDTYIGKKAPGVVNRGEKDETVTLTATIMDGLVPVSKDFTVIVLKKPEPISEDDYAGYLFGHFIGEAEAHEEQIYFAVSEDRLNFKDLNNLKPILTSNVGERGVRDPYLYRSPEGDRFFLIATDLSIYNRGGWHINEQGYYDPSTTGSSNLVLWQSTDLVNWSDAQLIDVAPANAGMAWAPEMIFNDETGEYIIFFSSSIMNPETKYKSKPNTIFYVATRDFVSFSPTQIFIDNQTDNEPDGKRREIIDTTVLKIGDTYYSASKDGDNAEPNGGIRIHKNKNLLDPNGWEKVLDLDELCLDMSGHRIEVLDNSQLEGPELFMFNKKDWTNPDIPEYGLSADQFQLGTGYLPFTTTDIEDADNSKSSWKLLNKSDYSFDKLKKRHGTIMRITKQEIDRLKENF